MSPKSLKNNLALSEIMENGPPNSCKMYKIWSWGCFGRPRVPFGHARWWLNLKKRPARYFLGAKVADLGRRFGPGWLPKASLNRHLCHRS